MRTPIPIPIAVAVAGVKLLPLQNTLNPEWPVICLIANGRAGMVDVDVNFGIEAFLHFNVEQL